MGKGEIGSTRVMELKRIGFAGVEMLKIGSEGFV